MSESDKNKPVLTIEQFTALYSVMGHAATQEQLNDVRKELNESISETRKELDGKISDLRKTIVTTVISSTLAIGALVVTLHQIA